MMESTSTYQAVQAVAPGRLELVRKPIRNPGPGEVRIRVEACGVCHSDSGTVDGLFPIDWPRVPGHEVVGRIDALGSARPRLGGRVSVWASGSSAGLAVIASICRNGDLVNCRNQEYHRHSSRRRIRRSDDRQGQRARCRSLTTCRRSTRRRCCARASRRSAPCAIRPAKAGDLVAVLGIGGLGHLGVQYARHMGFEVAAIARGADKAELAKKLGAHHYIDSAAEMSICVETCRSVGSGRRAWATTMGNMAST